MCVTGNTVAHTPDGRRPVWLARFVEDVNQQGVRCVRCSCGLWCVEQRDRVQWDKWDAGIIQDDDLTVAILLRRRLTRIIRTWGGVVLRHVWAGRGIGVDGRYLAAHDCLLPRITTRPWRRETNTSSRPDLSWLPFSHPLPGVRDPWATRLD